MPIGPSNLGTLIHTIIICIRNAIILMNNTKTISKLQNHWAINAYLLLKDFSNIAYSIIGNNTRPVCKTINLSLFFEMNLEHF